MTLVVCLNLFVRFVGGGEAHPLSLRHLDNKARAVITLALHFPKHLFSEHPQDLQSEVVAAAETVKLPARFVLRVAHAESDLRPHAISATGAMGLMQLMPDTAEHYGVSDPFDPIDNAAGAARYLRVLWRRYRGDRRRILAAYNLGPGRVPRRGRYEMPSETRAYVRRALGLRLPRIIHEDGQ